MKKLFMVVLILGALLLMSSCTITNDSTKMMSGYITTRYEFEEATCDVALKTYEGGMNGHGGLVGMFECWTPDYPDYIITGDIDIFSVK